MNKFVIYFLFSLLSFQTIAQTILYQQATGENLEAYKHEDKFHAWQKLTNGKATYIYYRAKLCTTIANERTKSVAHPIATIEVKAPDNIGGDTLIGFINVVGTKTLVADGTITNVLDTTMQFFDVSASNQIFTVDLALNYSEIKNVYVTFFGDENEIAQKETIDQKLEPTKLEIQKKLNPQSTSPEMKEIKKKNPASGIGKRG